MLFLLVTAFLILLFFLRFLEVDSNLIHAGRASLHIHAFVLITEGTLRTGPIDAPGTSKGAPSPAAITFPTVSLGGLVASSPAL